MFANDPDRARSSRSLVLVSNSLLWPFLGLLYQPAIVPEAGRFDPTLAQHGGHRARRLSPYSNAGDKSRQTAILSGTPRIRAANSERGAAIC
jgi:hypothetical protein